MEESHSLRLAIKSAEPIIKEYIRQLKAKNTNGQNEIVKLELKNQEYKVWVTALQKELKKARPTITVNLLPPVPPSEEETK